MCEHVEVILLREYQKRPQKKFKNKKVNDINHNDKKYHLAVCLDCNSTLFRCFDDYQKTSAMVEFKGSYQGWYHVYVRD